MKKVFFIVSESVMSVIGISVFLELEFKLRKRAFVFHYNFFFLKFMVNN